MNIIKLDNAPCVSVNAMANYYMCNSGQRPVTFNEPALKLATNVEAAAFSRIQIKICCSCAAHLCSGLLAVCIWDNLRR